MFESNLRIVPTSQTSGTFESTTGSSVRSDAAIAGSEAFLAPPMRTLPERRRPPAIRSLSIPLSGALSGFARDHHSRDAGEVGGDTEKLQTRAASELGDAAVLPLADLHEQEAALLQDGARLAHES
jgi:hypothetical protein